MSSRCKSCDAIFSEDELTYIDPSTGKYTDLCFDCISLCEDYSEDDCDLWEEDLE